MRGAGEAASGKGQALDTKWLQEADDRHASDKQRNALLGRFSTLGDGRRILVTIYKVYAVVCCLGVYFQRAASQELGSGGELLRRFNFYGSAFV